MKLVQKVFYIAGAVVLLGSTSLVAKEINAKEVINKVQNYLSSLDKYAFDAVISNEFTDNGKVEKNKTLVNVKLQRPDKLRVDVKNKNKDRTNYMNDGKYIMVDHSFGYYAEIDTPKSIDKTLDFLIEQFGINAPLTSLLYKDMPKRTKFTSSKNFGVMDVAGTQCDYVAFKNKNTVVHIWVATGDKPLVKAYSVIDANKEYTLRINTSIQWKDAWTIKEKDFIFIAPKNVMKISVEPAN